MAEMNARRELRGGTLLVVSAIAGLVGLAACGVGLAVDPAQALYSWLAAWAYASSTAIGALVFLLIGHAVDGKWVVVVRRLLHAITAAFPALALLFLPIALGAHEIYAWADPAAVTDEHARHLLDHKRPYLNVPAFFARTTAYFAVFIGAAELVRGWSIARDRRDSGGGRIGEKSRNGAPGGARADLGRERVLSAVMLPLVALALTFGAFDWTMSLQPDWFSTAYGVYFFAGGFVASLALVALLAWAGVRAGPLDGVVRRNHFHALGRMMLGFVCFWAYIAFFQLMLIEIANRPEEVTFYVQRSAGGWLGVSWLLIVGHFALPFLLLLPRRPKFRAGAMAVVAGWLLAMHYVDVYWLVLPVLHPRGVAPHWLDGAALLAVAGVAAAFATWRQRGLSLVAERDPRLAEALEYEGL